jgi:hypothetical protein
MFSVALVVAVGLLAGIAVLVWPLLHRSSRYTARMIALQWVQHPKFGSLLAIAVCVTSKDGGQLVPSDYEVFVTETGGQTLRPEFLSSATRYFPNQQAPTSIVESFFFLPNGKLSASPKMDGQLLQKMPPDPLQSLLTGIEPLWTDPVAGVVAIAPPMPPRSRQLTIPQFLGANAAR